MKCFTCSEKGIVIYYSKSKLICDICKGSLKKRNAPENVENVSSSTKRSNTTIKRVSSSSDGDDITKKLTFNYEHVNTHLQRSLLVNQYFVIHVLSLTAHLSWGKLVAMYASFDMGKKVMLAYSMLWRTTINIYLHKMP